MMVSVLEVEDIVAEYFPIGLPEFERSADHETLFGSPAFATPQGGMGCSFDEDARWAHWFYPRFRTVGGAVANPIIRNAQEKRQLAGIRAWLEARGYTALPPKIKFDAMPKGTFSFRLNVPVKQLEAGEATVNIPVDDAVIMPKDAKNGDFPLLIEAKSAGDFTNVNKRRKEEAVKMSQLRATYGPKVRFVLFLCGYFDSGYLGYEAAEGIDWVWEHRIDELAEFGV